VGGGGVGGTNTRESRKNKTGAEKVSNLLKLEWKKRSRGMRKPSTASGAGDERGTKEEKRRVKLIYQQKEKEHWDTRKGAKTKGEGENTLNAVRADRVCKKPKQTWGAQKADRPSSEGEGWEEGPES